MGHYDEQYEADVEQRQERRRQDLIRWINELVNDDENGQDQMALYHLEMIHDIVSNPKTYSNYFAFIGRQFPRR